MFSYNDASKIDRILLDRIKEINVKPFKMSDKKDIVNKFIINEEFTSENRHPILFYALIFPKNLPFFYVSHTERLMQAGWHSKDYVSIITCLRWDYKKLKQ